MSSTLVTISAQPKVGGVGTGDEHGPAKLVSLSLQSGGVMNVPCVQRITRCQRMMESAVSIGRCELKFETDSDL